MSTPSKTTQLLSTSRKKKVVKKKVLKKNISKRSIPKRIPLVVRTKRPNQIPLDVWEKMGPLERFNLESGVLSYDSDTRKTYQVDLREKVSKKITKKKSVRKKITKKTRRVDWLKSIKNQKLVMTSGEGSFHFDDGSKYTGQLKNGVFHGQGIRVWEDGTIFNGDWKDGVIQGHGRIIYPSGVEYIGSWKDGVKSGRGTLFRRNGTMFSGDWEDGLVKKPLPPRVVTETKVVKKGTVRKYSYFTISKKSSVGHESISTLGLPQKFVDQLKRSSILTLRDLTHYSPLEVIQMCGLSPKVGVGQLDQVRKTLRKYGLRMKSSKEKEYVDIRTLSLSERRRLKRPTGKKLRDLDKWGIKTSKNFG